MRGAIGYPHKGDVKTNSRIAGRDETGLPGANLCYNWADALLSAQIYLKRGFVLPFQKEEMRRCP